MKISVSSYSFQQYIKAGKLTQLTAIAAAKEIGLEAIEFIDLTPPEGVTQAEYAKELRAEADRLGMTINAYTVGANLFKETPEEEAALRADTVVTSVAYVDGKPCVRYVADAPYTPDSTQVKPTLEDAYIFALGGVKR